MNLTSIFGKFAGREVAVTESVEEIKIGGKLHQIPVNKLDSNDPVIVEMNKAAADNGLRLRIWLPGAMGTMDVRDDRVNADIKKEDDGKWRVQPGFEIG